jgi:hydroxyacylglutathione hydrolase
MTQPIDRVLGPHTTALIGFDGGRYPAGNSVLVSGSDSWAIIDPSTSLRHRDPIDGIEQVVLTHAHEDHMAGVHLFPDAAVSCHVGDLLGIHSLDGLMQIYGMAPDADARFRRTLVEDFTYVPRPGATGFEDGHVIDLGGVTIRVVHLPGHTRGHSGMLIEPDGVFVTGDIDLSAFGPYYGDAWSDLDAFEASLVRARAVHARWYVTFHHKGVIEGRDTYVELLDAFAGVIATREARMVDFASEPRSIDDFAQHRFVYRPHVELPFVDHVERRSATMSVARLLSSGRLIEVDTGRYAGTAR